MLGKQSWNKGLTSQDNEAIARQIQSVKEGYASGRITPSFKGREHTPEWKEQASLRQSVCNKGGRCQWFEVAHQKVQGTWEKAIAEKMESLGLRWEKIRTNSKTVAYKQNGKVRHYTPDFDCEDRFIEVKGYWRKEDREKMRLVFENNPNLRISILEKDQYLEALSSSNSAEFLRVVDKYMSCSSLDGQAGD